MVRVPIVVSAAGQVQIEVQRLGRLERHGLGERALEVLLQVGPAAVAGQAVKRAGQVLRGLLHSLSDRGAFNHAGARDDDE